MDTESPYLLISPPTINFSAHHSTASQASLLPLKNAKKTPNSGPLHLQVTLLVSINIHKLFSFILFRVLLKYNFFHVA
jgi:hypothetical protein